MANQTPFENTHNVWHPSIPKLCYRHEKSTKLIAFHDILYICTHDRQVNLAFLRNGKCELHKNIDRTLTSISCQPFNALYCIHVGTIVNLLYLSSIEDDRTLRLEYLLDKKFQISRSKYADFITYVKANAY